MRIIIRWVINALALFALPYIFTSIHVASIYVALITALALGLINALIRPAADFTNATDHDSNARPVHPHH